jgi:hypothetical protein
MENTSPPANVIVCKACRIIFADKIYILQSGSSGYYHLTNDLDLFHSSLISSSRQGCTSISPCAFHHAGIEFPTFNIQPCMTIARIMMGKCRLAVCTQGIFTIFVDMLLCLCQVMLDVSCVLL